MGVGRTFAGGAMVLGAITLPGCSKYLPKDSAAEQAAGKLRPIVQRFEINPNDAQLLIADSGVNVGFDAGALVLPDGSAPSDKATVTLSKYLYDTDPLPTDMPGGFQGRTMAGDIVALVSFGVMGIDIVDSSGEELELRDGATGTLTIPSVVSDPPASVPLWSFDTDQGLWIEEGTAKAAGDLFTATVPHFTMWNVDGACSDACIKGFISVDGLPKTLQVDGWTTEHNCYGIGEGQNGSTTYSAYNDGSFVLTGIASPATVEVSAEYEGEVKTVTVEIPPKGTACIDAGTIAFGKSSSTSGVASSGGGDGGGDCNRVLLDGVDGNYMQRNDVYVFTDLPSGVSLASGSFQPNSGTCTALTQGCGPLNINMGSPNWTVTTTGVNGTFDWGIEADANCKPVSSPNGDFDVYQLWFRLPGGGTGAFQGVTLQPGVGYAKAGDGTICEIGFPSFDAGITLHYQVSGTACLQ